MGFRWPTMPGSGEVQVAQGIGAIGAGIGRLGEAFAEKQARVRLDDFKLSVTKRMIELGNDIDEEQDEDKYQAMMDSAFSDLQGEIPKGMAGPFATSYLKSEKAAQLKSVDEAMELRVQSKWAVDEVKAQELYAISGNPLPHEEVVGTGLTNGYIKEDEAAHLLSRAQKNRAMAVAFGPNPDKILKYKSYQDLHKDYPLLKPGDYNDLRISAESQKSFIERQKEDWQIAFSNSVADMAMQGVPPDEAIPQIINKPGLTTEEKIHYSKVYGDAWRAVNTGKGNPYSTTQDWPTFAKVARMAQENPESVSFDVVRFGTGKYWTWAQEQYLLGLKDPTRKNEALRLPYWNEWDKAFDMLYIDKDGGIPQDQLVEWVQVKDTARQIYLENPDPKVAQQKLERYIDFIKK